MTEKSHIQLEMEAILAKREGRNFLRRVLFDYTAVLSSPHHIEPQVASYNAGRHAIGLLILNEVLDADPSAITLLLTEEKTDEQD